MGKSAAFALIAAALVGAVAWLFCVMYGIHWYLAAAAHGCFVALREWTFPPCAACGRRFATAIGRFFKRGGR